MLYFCCPQALQHFCEHGYWEHVHSSSFCSVSSCVVLLLSHDVIVEELMEQLLQKSLQWLL